VNSSKVTLITTQIIEKVQFIIGIIIVFLFGISALVLTFDKEMDFNTIIVMYVFVAIGVVFIVLSRRRRRLIKNFKDYVIRLSADPTGSIENLASSVNTSQDIVKANLQKMIYKKYFANAYIDEVQNRIVFPTIIDHNNVSNNSQQGDVQIKQEAEYLAVTCNNCGGVNKITKGKVQDCEFCGSPLNAK